MVTEPMRTARVALRTIAGVVCMAVLLNGGPAKEKLPPDSIPEAPREGERPRVLPTSSAPRPERQTCGPAIAGRRPQDLREHWRRPLPRPLELRRTKPHRFQPDHRLNRPVPRI